MFDMPSSLLEFIHQVTHHTHTLTHNSWQWYSNFTLNIPIYHCASNCHLSGWSCWSFGFSWLGCILYQQWMQEHFCWLSWTSPSTWCATSTSVGSQPSPQFATRTKEEKDSSNCKERQSWQGPPIHKEEKGERCWFPQQQGEFDGFNQECPTSIRLVLL